jgi:FMN reductase
MTVRQIIALSGNPRPNSRTLGLATHLAGRVAEVAGLAPGIVTTVDLIDYAPRLFDREAPDVRHLVATVTTADLVIVASPTFKGSYTGLLKAFIDQLPRTGLAGVTAIPLMVGVLAHHTDVHERMLGPLLTELDAAVLPGLFFLEEELTRPQRLIEAWLADHTPRVVQTLAGHTAEAAALV